LRNYLYSNMRKQYKYSVVSRVLTANTVAGSIVSVDLFISFYTVALWRGDGGINCEISANISLFRSLSFIVAYGIPEEV
jgi:predicted GNAT superfamily acetyltransferase